MNKYVLLEEESKRINILKFISIIFVLYIHAYTRDVNFASGSQLLTMPIWLEIIEYSISKVITRCGVPIFFIISSILLFKKERNYFSTIKSKIKTLLIPYIIWNTFWIIIFIILQNLPVTKEYFSGSNTPILKSSFMDWLGLYGIGKGKPHDYPLWFMRDLMVVIPFYPLIKRFTLKFPKFTLILGILLSFISIEIPFKICLQYFLIGSAIVALNIHMNYIDKINLRVITVVYFTSMILTIILNNKYLSNLFIIIGIIFWIRITKVLYDNVKLRNVFLKLSTYTFIIYVFHELTLGSVQKVCAKVLPTNAILLLLEYLFIPILIIVVCILVQKFLYKVMPKFYKIATGER